MTFAPDNSPVKTVFARARKPLYGTLFPIYEERDFYA